MKSRDIRRKIDMNQLRTALELYYDSNAGYPSTGGLWFSSEQSDNVGYNGGNYIPGITPYMPTLPRDPRGGVSPIQPTCSTWKSAYLYKSDGANYKLLSHCAPEGVWNSTDSFYDPAHPTWAWKVCSGDPTACNTW